MYIWWIPFQTDKWIATGFRKERGGGGEALVQQERKYPYGEEGKKKKE